MKIVFFGTPDFVVPVVDLIYKKFSTSVNKSVIAVVTQPPQPVGRDKKLTHSAVDQWAYRKKIENVYDNSKAPEADLAIVAAYGEIIPKIVLEKYKYGVINIHPSILPKWRGATPITASIISQEGCGVSFIKMDEEMDHGPIISSFKNYLHSETSEELTSILFSRAAEALIELIPNFIKGKVKLKEQIHDNASYCKRLTKQDGYVKPTYIKAVIDGEILDESMEIGFMNNFDLKITPENIYRFMLAMDPWPGIWTQIRLNSAGQELRLKILKAHIEDNKLILDQVQLEGKKPVNWKQFKEGYPKAEFV